MPLYSMRSDEPFIDPRTGQPTKRFLGLVREITALLQGLTFANIGGTLSLAQLVAHESTHRQGGADPLKLDDLATPDDTTDLNASVSRHGLLPKLTGNAAHRLGGDGEWH